MCPRPEFETQNTQNKLDSLLRSIENLKETDLVDRAICATECTKDPHSSLGIPCVDALTGLRATTDYPFGLRDGKLSSNVVSLSH